MAYSIPNFRATCRTDSRSACRSADSVKLIGRHLLGLVVGEDGEHRTDLDRGAGRDGQRRHPPGPVGTHDVLHLHGLDDEQFLARD